jgi:ribonucleotide monophosphatase NagD (HAD superfamily)
MTASELFGEYDVFFVDMFGVILAGVSRNDGTMETLAALVKARKTAIILSNASISTGHMLRKYASSAIRQGEQFSEFVTSGEVLHYILQSGTLSFASVKSPRTYTLLRNQICSNVNDTTYVYAHSIDEADFTYALIPRLCGKQKALPRKELQNFVVVSNMRSEGELVWDSTSV